MASLNIIPERFADYYFCCVFPFEAARSWPGFLQRPNYEAIALEFDLEGEFAERHSVEHSYTQSWPADTIKLLREAGKEVRMHGGTVPVVGPAVLDPPPRSTLHYVTLALCDSVQSEVTTLADWQEVRAILQRSVQPARWPGPGGCEAFLHVAEADYCYLLTCRRELLTNWLAIVLQQGFPELKSTAHARGVADWVLAEANHRGLRLWKTLTEQAGPREAMVRLHGAWGPDPTIPLTIGKPTLETFREEVFVAGWSD